MRDKIHGRDPFVGSGMMNTPERIDELEARRAQHERLTRGKPVKPFGELLEEKLKKHGRGQGQGKGEEEKQEEEAPEENAKGAIDPHLGLVPSQKPSIANTKSGHRSSKVIVKG